MEIIKNELLKIIKYFSITVGKLCDSKKKFKDLFIITHFRIARNLRCDTWDVEGSTECGQ